jgi:two-component system sensor histidine kinase AlgZ
MDILSEEVLLAILALSLTGSIYLYRKLSKERKAKDELFGEKTQLEMDNLRLKAEHLKFRLQPHTLKNILAHLQTIASNLNRGMESFSATLDYILYQGDANYVSVKSELDFVKGYLELNDIFLPEIDSCELNDSEVNKKSKFYEEECIPHLITAYFLENAFKHGDLNHPEFLGIKVRLTDAVFEIQVINRIKTFTMHTKSGGIGQKNMKSRLELLLPNRYDIQFSCNETEYHSMLKIDLI